MTKAATTLSPCSKEELDYWITKGLIPKALLSPSKALELEAFVAENREQFRSEITNKERAFLETPSSHEFHVVDARTGNVVSVLERAAKFELCDGVFVQVKAKEIDEWKQETSNAQDLTEEQSKELKEFILKFENNRTLSRKEIVAVIEEIRKPKKTPKYRHSGHLVDQKLKYSDGSSSQAKILEALSSGVQQEIKESKIEIKAEGIKLTPSENKLIHALNRILYDKSQNTKDPKKGNFYEGNGPTQIVPYGEDLQAKAVVLKFKPAELYKAYIGHDRYSSHDIEFINSTLRQMESKKVLIKYDRIKKVIKNKKTETLTDRIEYFESLVKIIFFTPDLTNEEKDRLDKGDNSIREIKGEMIVGLNPIFTDQIETKFIEFPIDTNRRLVIAAGGHKKVTSSMMTLMEWTLREISAKRYKLEINEERLPYLLGLETYVKQNRKKRLQERIAKDIEAVVNMGIILQSEKQENTTGGFKWVFHLNEQYE